MRRKYTGAPLRSFYVPVIVPFHSSSLISHLLFTIEHMHKINVEVPKEPYSGYFKLISLSVKAPISADTRKLKLHVRCT